MAARSPCTPHAGTRVPPWPMTPLTTSTASIIPTACSLVDSPAAWSTMVGVMRSFLRTSCTTSIREPAESSRCSSWASAAAVRPTVAIVAAHIAATRHVTMAEGTFEAQVVAKASRSINTGLIAATS